jgi:N-acetylglutamate synthase-like GNAT family acetyltransferase
LALFCVPSTYPSVGRNRFEPGGTSLPIRIAEKSEANAITGVINAAFAKAERAFGNGDRIDLQEVQSNLDTGEFLVFEEDGVITACVYVKMQGQRSYLGLLPVDPKAQKSGSGSKVMNAAEDHCRNAGSRFMDIRIVNLRKELPDFYHHRGYEDAGTEPFAAGFIPLIPGHFVKMSKPL